MEAEPFICGFERFKNFIQEGGCPRRRCGGSPLIKQEMAKQHLRFMTIILLKGATELTVYDTQTRLRPIGPFSPVGRGTGKLRFVTSSEAVLKTLWATVESHVI